MRIKLLSTWSKLVEEPEIAPNVQLVTHQREVWDAVRHPDIQIVFDTALTGDGKTLAATLPIFYDRKFLDKGLFAYPTNELIRDQARQVENWSDRLKPKSKPRTGQLNSSTLAAQIREEGFDRKETLRNIANNNQVILTNPDIFTLIHRMFYDRRWGNAATIAQTWLAYYRYIVFDEFHIFSAPQIANVLDGIAFIRANASESHPTKFLFLSATPDQLLLDALERASITPKVIQGNYAHGLKESSTNPKLNDTETHRRILHEVELELVASQQDRGGIEAWISENLGAISSFFEQYPESKGLLIVNSVFAAKKIIRMLRSLPNLRISIGENTGLTSLDVRKESEKAQLVVATSTVDVGVDFAINFLIYESLDAGTFIQRLGRLGRHDGFSIYKAIALVPDWVHEKFSKTYSSNTEIDRESFFGTVRENIYKKPQEFESYLNRWGTALSSLRYARLNKQKQQYQTLLENYLREVSPLIGETPNWDKLKLLSEHQIITKDLETFRGSGQLDVWVHDPDTQAITSMSLIRLLAGTEFILVSEEEARKISDRLDSPFYKNKLGLYACIENYLQTYEKVELQFTDNLDNLSINIAQERKGFRLKARHISIQQINEKLEYLPLTTCVADPTKFDIAALRRWYRLPALFELHMVRDCSGATYPVAFGLDALLLDSLIFWIKPNGVIIH